MPYRSGRTMLVVWLAAGTIPLGGGTHAQGITVDGRLSPAQTLAGPNYAIGAGLGRQVGANLFHSFGAFGLRQGETATFGGPPSIGNVIGRVTGGAASSINGAINSAIPGANLYLINPAGVVFGPNASVDVSGSFHASSADYLRMKDGSRFAATNPDASTLSAAPPEAFGFLSASPQPVMVDRSTLQLPSRRTLGLVGGAVTISGGQLIAPAGTIHVASAAGPGEVPVNPNVGSPPATARSGRVQVANNTTILASGSNGSVFIRAGELSVTASAIEADTSGPGPGGVLSLRGDRTVSISNGATVRAVTSGTGRGPGINVGTAAGGTVTLDAAAVGTTALAAGEGGAVAINTGTLKLQNGAMVSSRTAGRGNGGPINVGADSILLDGPGTKLASQTTGTRLMDASGVSLPAGVGGTISLSGGTLRVQNNASIEADTLGSGVGGSIGIAMTGNVTVVTGSQIMSSSNITAAPSPATATEDGGAGTIILNAGALTLSHGGSVRSTALASGSAGEVTLNVNSALTIDGGDNGGFVNGVSSEAAVGSSGSAGVVRVSAGSISVLNGGFINGNTRGTGRGGSVLVTTPGTLLLDGGVGTGITVVAFGPQSGDAGTVTVSAGSIAVQGGARISSGTNGLGQSGDVTVNAGSVSVLNHSFIGSITEGTGLGGSVTVNTGALTLSRAGAVISSTFGSGNAGEVVVNVKGALTIEGVNDGASFTGVSSMAQTGSSGSAGTVRVNAGSISALNSGGIDSNTLGTGAAGSVLVTTPGAVLLDGGGGDGSGITAAAAGPQSGDAGTVTINAGAVTLQNVAQINSYTGGPGRGGSVTVNTGTLTLSRSSIISSTLGSGNAGEVVVNVKGAFTVDGAGGGNFGSGVGSEALPNSSGSAGTVRVNAGGISIFEGAIASDTRGTATGAGGSVVVTTPGALLLDGRGNADTRISASAFGARSSGAGTVTVSAGSVAVQGGAGINSFTNGPGRGGDVSVTAGSAIRLSGSGPTITALSSGTGDAGSIAVAAPRVELRDEASISTAARMANGGNITIGPGDLLYLQRSAITTSVGGASGNGGNITVEPQLVVLDRSAIQANAVGGNGGNVSVQAEQLVQSFDSAITASSQRGVSGRILVAAQPLNLNGSLVVLASELRSAAALLREGCAVRGASPRSSLVAAGRGGQRQGLEATVPALYFARRPVRDGEGPAPDAPAATARVSLGLSSQCGQ